MTAQPAPHLAAEPGTRPRLGLMRLFAASGALAIGIFSLVLALVLGRSIESRLLESDAEISRDFVQSIADTQKIAAVLGSSADDARVALDPTFAEFIAHLGAMPSVLRVNVYSPRRTVLWSTRGEMIGRSFDDNDELDEALRGEVVAHAAHAPDKAEHMMMAARHQYIENYLPVTDADGRIMAVVELYRRPDDLFAAIRSGQRLMAWSAAGGGLFLFACLIGFVLHAERRLRNQQRRLVDAEAMAIVGEISAAVAHSIRNPLGSIRSSAELHRELAGDDDGSQTEIMRQVDRIEGLVRSMLAYAADGAPRADRAARTDLDAIVDELAGTMAGELGRQGKRLELDLTRGLGRVAAESVLIQQVLQSLLNNAAEATREGGRIRLRSGREGDMAFLEVVDDGVGIAPERMGLVLKPFNTSTPRGLGMGLALAHRVARRLGGDLVLASEPGQGTRVRLTLPVQAAADGGAMGGANPP